jgi:hypothetical protein
LPPFLCLLLLFDEIFLQVVESVFPEFAMARDPLRRGVHRSGIEPAVVDPTLSAPCEESRFFQNLQVLRDRGERDVERLGEVGDAELARRQSRQDRAPRRIGEGAEGPIERSGIVNHPVN